MNEDDESAALAHQQELEARRFQEWQELLKADAEAYHQWLDTVSREERDDA